MKIRNVTRRVLTENGGGSVVDAFVRVAFTPTNVSAEHRVILLRDENEVA